jgi:ECF sigma factor
MRRLLVKAPGFALLQRMAQEAPGQTLQATVLVYDAYLRLVGDKKRTSSVR